MNKKKIVNMVFLLIIPISIFIIWLLLSNTCKTDKSAAYVFSVANKGSANYTIEVSGTLSEGETLKSSVQMGAEGEKLLRWGIKRNTEGQIPAADPGAPELLQKYGALFLGNTLEKKIYFTFDEGYENGYTSKILDTLLEKKVKAVFFITGPYLLNHSDLISRMITEGHEIGNHTVGHPSLPQKSSDIVETEVNELNRMFFEKYKYNMRFFRAPMGEYSQRTLEIIKKLGYCNLFWSFAYDDWYRDKTRGASFAHDIVTRNLHNGAVLLLHAVSKDNADALGEIIDTAREKGYEIGTPEELWRVGEKIG